VQLADPLERHQVPRGEQAMLHVRHQVRAPRDGEYGLIAGQQAQRLGQRAGAVVCVFVQPEHGFVSL
jgi:hypothetical protein